MWVQRGARNPMSIIKSPMRAESTLHKFYMWCYFPALRLLCNPIGVAELLSAFKYFCFTKVEVCEAYLSETKDHGTFYLLHITLKYFPIFHLSQLAMPIDEPRLSSKVWKSCGVLTARK